MGEIADAVVNGEMCSLCHQEFDGSHGYPVVCIECWKNLKPAGRTAHHKAHLPVLNGA